jgi:hypothetical protein
MRTCCPFPRTTRRISAGHCAGAPGTQRNDAVSPRERQLVEGSCYRKPASPTIPVRCRRRAVKLAGDHRETYGCWDLAPATNVNWPFARSSGAVIRSRSSAHPARAEPVNQKHGRAPRTSSRHNPKSCAAGQPTRTAAGGVLEAETWGRRGPAHSGRNRCVSACSRGPRRVFRTSRSDGTSGRDQRRPRASNRAPRDSRGTSGAPACGRNSCRRCRPPVSSTSG